MDFAAVMSQVNDFVWGPVMLFFLVGTGVFLTIRLKFRPWLNLPYAVKMIMKKKDRQLIISMLAAEIMEEHICYLNELVEKHIHIPEEIGIIKDCSYFFRSLIDEQWKKANPKGRISQNEVRIVYDFDE